jgi:hypothetical protein
MRLKFCFEEAALKLPNTASKHGYFCDGMRWNSLLELFLRRMQAGTAFRNLSFLALV